MYEYLPIVNNNKKLLLLFIACYIPVLFAVRKHDDYLNSTKAMAENRQRLHKLISRMSKATDGLSPAVIHTCKQLVDVFDAVEILRSDHRAQARSTSRLRAQHLWGGPLGVEREQSKMEILRSDHRERSKMDRAQKDSVASQNLQNEAFALQELRTAIASDVSNASMKLEKELDAYDNAKTKMQDLENKYYLSEKNLQLQLPKKIEALKTAINHVTSLPVVDP